MPRYWLRTTRGLEWLVAAEVAAVADSPRMTLGHRDVFFDSADNVEPTALRCADDVFLFWAHLCNVDHTREALRRLADAAAHLPPVPEVASGLTWLHVTASFLGRRNYSRGEIECAFGMSLAEKLGLKWCEKMPESALSLRVRIHVAGDRAAIGVALTPKPIHRRPWRVYTRRGMLHPPVAASMALLAGLHEGLAVCDPFAGSGTLLIEAGLRCPDLRLSGWDIDPEAVAIASEHTANAGVAADFRVGDGLLRLRDLPKPDRVLSNPPWGRSVATSGPSGAEPLKVLLNLLGSETRLVVVADRSMEMASFWERNGCKPEIVFPIRVSGRIADIGVLSARPTSLWRDFGPWWKAMEGIPWEGDDSEGTLNIPPDWGLPMRLR